MKTFVILVVRKFEINVIFMVYLKNTVKCLKIYLKYQHLIFIKLVYSSEGIKFYTELYIIILSKFTNLLILENLYSKF